MKKTMIVLSVVALTSCGSSKHDEESNKKVVCDSVKQVMYDAAGTEFTAMVYKCDTIEETK